MKMAVWDALYIAGEGCHSMVKATKRFASGIIWHVGRTEREICHMRRAMARALHSARQVAEKQHPSNAQRITENWI